MKRKILGVAAAGILAAVFFFSSAAPRPVSADELGEAEARLADLESQQQQVRDRISALESEKSNIETYLEELNTQLDTVGSDYNAIQQQLADISLQMTDAKDALAESERLSEEQYEAMKLRIQYMYERGETGVLDLIFSSGSLSDLLSRAEYVAEMTKYDRDMLEEYRKTQEEIRQKTEELSVLVASLDQSQAELAIQGETLGLLIDAKTVELDE